MEDISQEMHTLYMHNYSIILYSIIHVGSGSINVVF